MTDEILSEKIERGIPLPPRKRNPVGIDWGAIMDGDSIVAQNHRRAATLITSFTFFKKRNPSHSSFVVKQRKNTDGTLRLFFEDTEAEMRAKLLRAGLIIPR